MNSLFEDFTKKFTLGFSVMIVLVIVLGVLGLVVWLAPLLLLGILAFIALSLIVGHLIFNWEDITGSEYDE